MNKSGPKTIKLYNCKNDSFDFSDTENCNVSEQIELKEKHISDFEPINLKQFNFQVFV